MTRLEKFLLVASALVSVGLVAIFLAGCYPPGGPGPTTVNDPTQPPFPIKPSPCAGNIDPHCWPFAADKLVDGGTTKE